MMTKEEKQEIIERMNGIKKEELIKMYADNIEVNMQYTDYVNKVESEIVDMLWKTEEELGALLKRETNPISYIELKAKAETITNIREMFYKTRERLRDKFYNEQTQMPCNCSEVKENE